MASAFATPQAQAKRVSSPDAGGGGGELKETSSWAAVRTAVMDRVGVSNAFKTLRDRAGDAVIDGDALTPIKLLGEGAFARVESAWYQPPGGGERYMVAVKHLHSELFQKPDDLALFMDEVDLMKKLQHRNIVGFVGAGSDKEGAFVAQEFLGGGTLKAFVIKQMVAGTSRRLYSEADALEICLQMARGIRYLHECKPMVIHRDLKLENVLLKEAKPKDGSWEVKIADFGLSTRVDAKDAALAERRGSMVTSASRASSPAEAAAIENDLERVWSERTANTVLSPQASHIGGQPASRRSSFSRLPSLKPKAAVAFNLTGRTGSLMYMAPEVYAQQPYNEKADVFSFGLMAYEVFSRYLMLSAVTVRGSYDELEIYAKRVAGGYRPPVNAAAWPKAVSELVQECWAQDPAKRPSMGEVVARLEDVQASGVVGGPHAGLVTVEPSACTCVVS